MRYIRELIQKGDPRVSMLLPKTLIEELMQQAKNNKRRYQDEFIKLIARTFRFPEAFKDTEEEFAKNILTFYRSTGECK